MSCALRKSLQMLQKQQENWNQKCGPKTGLDCCDFMTKLQQMRRCFLGVNEESGFWGRTLLLVVMP